ncbi:EamA family transporter [Candidatus Woesearchaeota archaeon]|nr:EamA family transporter [Candidatus Woesearchaeota archaeon]
MDKHYAYVALSATIFGSMGLVVRMISIPGIAMYFFAALISALLMAGILYKEGSLRFDRRYLWILILMALFNILNNATYFFAYKMTTIANATFAHYLAPVLIVLFAPFMLHDKTDKKIWIAIVLALLGLFVLIRPGTLNSGSSDALGIGLALISAIGYAAVMLLSRKASKYYQPKQILFGQMGFAALFLAPVMLYLQPDIAATDIIPLLILGLVHQCFAVLLIVKAIRALPAQNVSIVTYLEPVSAVILAFIFLNEVPSIATLLGGALILASCYLITKK